jgi:hypothetical protein
MSKIKHIALFKFKDGTPSEEVDRVFNEIMDASENIPGVEDYVSGPNNSPEGLNDGFSHGFVMTFTDPPARDAFLANPEHERIKSVFAPHVEKLAILDFEV